MKTLELKYKIYFKKCLETLIRRTLLFLIVCYRCHLSAFFGGACRFTPTCSNYAYTAFKNFSLSKAFYLTLKRFFCCHPLSKKFGYDPLEREEFSP